MSFTKSAKDKVEPIKEEESLCHALEQAETPEEICRLLAEKGIEITVDEVVRLAIYSNRPDAELNEETLEEISGGKAMIAMRDIRTVAVDLMKGKQKRAKLTEL